MIYEPRFCDSIPLPGLTHPTTLIKKVARLSIARMLKKVVLFSFHSNQELSAQCIITKKLVQRLA